MINVFLIKKIINNKPTNIKIGFIFLNFTIFKFSKYLFILSTLSPEKNSIIGINAAKPTLSKIAAIKVNKTN